MVEYSLKYSLTNICLGKIDPSSIVEKREIELYKSVNYSVILIFESKIRLLKS